MKWISLIFLFHLLNLSSGCLKLNQLGLTTTLPRRTTPPPPCLCGNFDQFMKVTQNILYTYIDTCHVNVTCISDFNTNLYGYWGEIPKPNTAMRPYFTLPTYKSGSNIHEFIDLHEYFGIQCQDENKRFYATKYPNGISYMQADGKVFHIFTEGKFDGKKTEIFSGQCAPLNPVEQTTVMPRRTTPSFSCSCGNFGQFMKVTQNILYTYIDTCHVNVTCISDINTNLYGYWGEVPKPNTAMRPYFTLETYKNGSNIHDFVDLHEYFGIQCEEENNRFYATKYPNGISYMSYDGRVFYMYTDGGLEGKKRKFTVDNGKKL
uniref:CUB domain-containing protein n=1 Tax=Caenorhabditis tropicalis TaxID=1561998 RepID=A0A1I7TGV9_9PELO